MFSRHDQFAVQAAVGNLDQLGVRQYLRQTATVRTGLQRQGSYQRPVPQGMFMLARQRYHLQQ